MAAPTARMAELQKQQTALIDDLQRYQVELTNASNVIARVHTRLGEITSMLGTAEHLVENRLVTDSALGLTLGHALDDAREVARHETLHWLREYQRCWPGFEENKTMLLAAKRELDEVHVQIRAEMVEGGEVPRTVATTVGDLPSLDLRS